jgi:hypothetical protein
MRGTMVVKVDELTQNQRSMRYCMVVENRPTAPPPPIEKLMLMSWGAASFKIKDSRFMTYYIINNFP